ncbi:MAG TPA: DUF4933 domain-containing protein [Bacteroidales bacterium]|mgnify:CR=1 FL=1|nr:DUF4933 domain-containing protein [Bacteroidales bacterium]HPT02200.1 DUF4933 domain-containing protein [Bacteroidales bacterium]
MKFEILLIALLLLLVGETSCNRNRLKMDEQSLVKELADEQKSGVWQNGQATGSFSNAKPGIRYKEIRSADPSNPPVVIDIAAVQDHAAKIKASRLFQQIQVVRIPADETKSPLSHYSKNYIISNRHIYQFSRFTGIRQYDMRGRLVKDICDNNMPYIDNGEGSVAVDAREYKQQFSGAVSARLVDGKFYYQYENQPGDQCELKMVDDADNAPSISDNRTGVENHRNFEGFGKTVIDFGKPSGNGINPNLYCILPGNQLATYSSAKSPAGNAPLLTLLTKNGDTVCIFNDYDPVKHLKGRVYRSPDENYMYPVDNQFHIKPAFNDTIFELLPPNRLLAKFVLHFGDRGVNNSTEGMDPQFNLKDKLLLNDLIESDKYIFITYTRDYSCPNTAKHGTLKYGRIIFDKSKHEVIAVYSCEKPEINPEQPFSWPKAPEKNIENDLNGCPFFWPTGVTADNKPFAAVSGKRLMRYFRPGQAAPMETLQENDMVIFIYK